MPPDQVRGLKADRSPPDLIRGPAKAINIMGLRGLRRVPALAFGFALPSAAVLAGLFIAGRLDLLAALGAAAAILVLLAIVAAPFALSLAAVQQAIDAL